MPILVEFCLKLALYEVTTANDQLLCRHIPSMRASTTRNQSTSTLQDTKQKVISDWISPEVFKSAHNLILLTWSLLNTWALAVTGFLLR